MSKYNSKEQLNKITQSFSKIFDIKLSKVRHKVSLDEGFKSYEAHLKSFEKKEIKEETKIPDSYSISSADLFKLSMVESIQQRPGMYVGYLKSFYQDIFDTIFLYSVKDFKMGFCDIIDVKFNKNKEIEISDNSSRDLTCYFEHDISIFEKGMGYEKSEENEIPFPYGDSNLSSFIIVNALSIEFKLVYKTKTHVYEREYEKGKLINNSKKEKSINDNECGLFTKFKINEDLIEEKQDIKTIFSEISKTSMLNQGLTVNVTDMNSNKVVYFEKSSKGLFNKKYKNKFKKLKMIEIFSKDKETNCSISVCFINDHSDDSFECDSYINDYFTSLGGEHEKEIKEFISNHSYKYGVDSNLKGIKAVLIVNLNDFKLSTARNKLLTHNNGYTKTTIQKLLNKI
jgi:DNA gyrase/topoisomerase IV subunit B